MGKIVKNNARKVNTWGRRLTRFALYGLVFPALALILSPFVSNGTFSHTAPTANAAHDNERGFRDTANPGERGGHGRSRGTDSWR